MSDEKASTDQKEGMMKQPRHVVGIGASAGGLAACTELLEQVPADTGMAFIIVMHLAADNISHLGELFTRATEMPVVSVSSPGHLRADHVYVIVPDTMLSLQGDTLSPIPREKSTGVQKPADALFSDLARHWAERAIGVVLSGTGDDGARGLRAIREAGGVCLVQDPEGAGFSGMPKAAIAEGIAEHVLSPADIGHYLGRYRLEDAAPKSTHEISAVPVTGSPADEIEPESEEFLQILQFLTQRYGLNFDDYRRGTLIRRISRRMMISRVSDAQSFLELLRQDLDEADKLYQDLLIDVTQFFRDPQVWDYLSDEIIPKILARHDAQAPLRFWVSACSSAEEAYSLGMLLLEALEEAGAKTHVQIFATDINERALAVGRKGRYSAAAVGGISPERLDRFFERHRDDFQIKPKLREIVTFAVHNVLANPPFSRMHLVSCRNLLIYLEPEAQRRALSVLKYALEPCGYLVLGASESIGDNRIGLETISNKWRVFQAPANASPAKDAKSSFRELPRALHTALVPPQRLTSERPDTERNQKFLQRYILGHYAAASVVIDGGLQIRQFFGPTDEYLLAPIGRADLDLLAWLRPGLYDGLQAAIDEVLKEPKRLETGVMRVEHDGHDARVSCLVEPLSSIPGGEGHYLVVFRPMPAEPDRPEDVPQAQRALIAKLETRLRGARREQSRLIAQLDATSEEYQAHHEELLSLNEELQSSNEELESSKEELHVLNTEMRKINQELQSTNEELAEVNDDLNNLFISTDIPTIFLDRDLKIRRFTPASTRVMHLLPGDVGRSIEDIKERFGGLELVELSRTILAGGEPMERDIRTEDGHYYNLRVLPYNSDTQGIDGVGLTFSDVTAERQKTLEAQKEREYSETVLRTIRTSLLVLDDDFYVKTANRAFCEEFTQSGESVVGRRLFKISGGRWDISELRELLQKILSEKHEVIDYDLEWNFEDTGRRFFRINANAMMGLNAERLIVLSIDDITHRRNAELASQKRRDELVAERERKNEFLAMLGHELRNPLAAMTFAVEVLAAAEDPQRKDAAYATVSRQLHRMTSLLDQLLEMGRLATGKIILNLQPTDMADVVRSAVEVVTPFVDKHSHRLEVSLPADEIIVSGDADRLSQVIENLLTNAAKYTEDGGRIEVTLQKTDKEVVVSIRDSGIGLTPKLLSRVFDPFVQAKRTLERAEGGLGLGLPLAKDLIELHHGQLTAHSEGIGQGSTFVFTLPLPSRTLKLDAARRPEDAHTVHPTPARAWRILIIDDEEDISSFFADVLRDQGYQVEMALDGLHGIEIARDFKPRVVLLDLGLPDMDGYAVAHRLREDFAGQPLFIVAISGYPKDEEKLHAAGFDEHLLKPPDIDQLLGWVDALE